MKRIDIDTRHNATKINIKTDPHTISQFYIYKKMIIIISEHVWWFRFLLLLFQIWCECMRMPMHIQRLPFQSRFAYFVHDLKISIFLLFLCFYLISFYFILFESKIYRDEPTIYPFFLGPEFLCKCHLVCSFIFLHFHCRSDNQWPIFIFHKRLFNKLKTNSLHVRILFAYEATHKVKHGREAKKKKCTFSDAKKNSSNWDLQTT